MAPRLRRLSAREVVRALGRLGFEVVSTRGSHSKLRRVSSEGARQVLTLPLLKDLDAATLQATYRQACGFVPEDALRGHFYAT